MGKVVSNYVSDHTRWMNDQLAKNPEWTADQQAGRAIWWDRPQTEEGRRATAEAKVAQKSYPYDNNF